MGMRRLTQLLAISALAAPLDAQDLENRGSPIAWQYSLRLPAGVIHGSIANDDGEPLKGVMIAIDGTGLVTATKTDGRFELSGVPSGERILTLRAIGFSQATLRLTVPSDHGITVAALLTKAFIGARCGDMVGRGDGIRARVLDSLTNHPPTAPVTIRLERGDSSWERTTRAPDGDLAPYASFFLPHVIETPGHYSIQITAPGYRTWRLENVFLEVELAVCSWTAASREYTVRLVPLRELHSFSLSSAPAAASRLSRSLPSRGARSRPRA